MGYKFITEQEINFINTINRELIQHVVAQEVIYYAIAVKQTQVDDLYNEAIKKTWNPPVRVNARVFWDNPTVRSISAGQDSQYSLEVYFHTKELVERNLVPREGDFIEYGQVFFEITSVTQPQIVFGEINNRIMTKCVCVPAREGQFQAGNITRESVDHSHPVQNSVHIPR